MEEMATTLKVTVAYENTDFTRQYSRGVSAQTAMAAKDKIMGINHSLKSGTTDGLNTFFISDNGDNLAQIISAKLISVAEDAITIEPSSN